MKRNSARRKKHAVKTLFGVVSEIVAPVRKKASPKLPVKVRPEPVKRKRVKAAVKEHVTPGVPSAFNRLAPVVPEKYVLVYAGEHTAFCVREFNSELAMAQFIVASSLTSLEYAIITGRVKRCDPRYKSDTAARPPWDDGEANETGGEIYTSSQPLSSADVDALINGK